MAETAGEAQGSDASSSSTSLRTFLLADLRGYTAYTQQHGDDAAGRLSERFLALCREIIEQYAGEVFGSAGDQALAAFPSARQALRASVALQTRLASEQEAHPDLPLRAGIGLDAGEAINVGDDYRGGAINLAARLCSLAGAGEIFASAGVIHLARHTEGVAVLDRGEVRLKGLEQPVRVLQIVSEGTEPQEVSPLEPLMAIPPTNLPDAHTPFIGREQEIDQIARLLRDPQIRLVTLTGPGGTGKTRLALQVGNTLLHDFPDGVFFVSLASLADPALVPSAMAEALAVTEEASKVILATLNDVLRDKHVLLVLDNFEHLLEAASVVSALLAACRHLQVLVTSRIPLHLSREHEYPVPPLALPDPRQVFDLNELSENEAVAFFTDRALAVKPDFAVTKENARAVAEICARLDGLPLAIELAAARIKLFPPQALLQRLERRLTLLTGGARDRPSRQQTLRSTIAWSYSLLAMEDQTLFARLSVFAGGCSFEAAEAVCNPEGDLHLLEGLASLLDKSLLQQEGDEEPRFRMLETIREYARDQLGGRDEARMIHGAYAAYFLQLAEAAEGELRGPGQGTWLVRLDLELDNLRGAMQVFLEQGAIEEELRLATALFWFWDVRGHWSEGRRWLEAGEVAGEERIKPEMRAKVLLCLGTFAQKRADAEGATRLLEESLALYRELGDQRGSARALNTLGIVAAVHGQYERATAYFEESLPLSRELGDRARIASTLGNLGVMASVYGGLKRPHWER